MPNDLQGALAPNLMLQAFWGYYIELAFNQFYKKNPYQNYEPYLITMGKMEGCSVQDSLRFFAYCWLEDQPIYILKKQKINE